MKRYFWLVNVVALVACSALAARAAVHAVEGAYLSETASPRQAPLRAKRPPRPLRSKLGAVLVERNMFCSSCAPLSEEPAPIVSSDGTPPATELPLRLIATTIAGDRDRSFATIHDGGSERSGAYRVGDGIEGAGEVLHIGPRYVDFRNATAGRVERLDLLASPSNPRTARKHKKRPRRSKRAADLDDRIRKIDGDHYEVDRSLIDDVLTNPRRMRGARIVPSIKNGQPNGFKVYRVRASSPLAKIGIKNGDTIHSINGFRITSPDKALEAYTKLRSANSVSLSITRRGKPKSLQYSIR